MRIVTVLCLLVLIVVMAPAQLVGPKTANFYVVTLNGTAVAVDGELDDWSDADFVFISQDGPNHRLYAGDQPTASPADFSANVAMKMDNATMYFAAHVRDEGGVLIHDPFTVSNAGTMWQKDHFAVYLGLYDIGDLPGSPHTNVVDILDAQQNVVASGRTYRVKPGADNDPQNATLGADYQIGVAIQAYETTLENGAFYADSADVINYNWGYVDTTIANTQLAIKVWDDGLGYTVEWAVPLASLAGFIAKSSAAQSVVEWPLYEPEDGDVIIFDFDLTDEDRVNQTGSNFLRFGPNGNLWRDSFNFGGRALVRDAAQISRSNYYFTQLTEDASVTVDGEIDDWSNIQFIGMSQDSPNRGFFLGGQATTSPADFSGYMAMRMDNENHYFVVHVRDEGGVLIHDPFTVSNAGTMWQKDHFAVYLGLYNIGALPASPHVNTVSIYNPQQVAVAGGRTYRVGPGTDDDPLNATLGADYQTGIAIQPYETVLGNGAFFADSADVINYNWGYVDTTIANTELAIKVWDNGFGYTAEWKVPRESLAGFIAKSSTGQSVIEWPLYSPSDGDVFVFDVDMTDEDRPNQTSSNFLRFGPYGNLWRDSFNFGLRAKVLATDSSHVTALERIVAVSLPADYSLSQNYPNPFNPSTTFEFDIVRAGQVRFVVYDVIGREVATLVDKYLNAGHYTLNWHAGQNLASGIYFYALITENGQQIRKMMLLK